MKDVTKNKLIDYLNNNGLYETSKLVGLPTYEIVRMLNIKLDVVTSNMVLSDMLSDNKLPKLNIVDDMYIDGFSGVWYIKTKHNINDEFYGILITMATPFYDGSEIVPVDSDNFTVYRKKDNKEVISIEEYEYTGYDVDGNFENIKELLKWYKNFYIPMVTEAINKHAEINIRRFLTD
jgi:hypothetical protein